MITIIGGFFVCFFFFLQFNFVNCFASLFYIAFVMQDMALLRHVSNNKTDWFE